MTEPVFLLLLSIAALLVAPVVVPWMRRDRRLVQGLDGFVLVSIGLLVALHLVPHAVEDAGPIAIGTFLLGLIVPILLERVGHVRAKHAHAFALALGLLALLSHAVIDGVALAGAGDVSGLLHHDHAHHGHGHSHAHHDHSGMGIGVVLHRLPVGVALWWIARPRYGRLAGWGVLAATSAATIAGFALGADWMEHATFETLGLFQGFVSGLLLHVMFHRHEHGDDGHGDAHAPADPCCAPAAAPSQWPETIGGAVGALGFLVLPAFLGVDLVDPMVREWAHRLLDLTLESAPALLLGFALAGLGGVLLPRASLGWLGRGRQMSQAARGMLFGLPLPICSCGVVPMYRSLVGRGAPSTAAMAFLIATPELGIEALILSVPFLGWNLTGARLAAAAFVALLAGWFVGRAVPRLATPELDAAADEDRPPLAERVVAGLRHGFVDIADDIAVWLVFGLAVAAMFDPGEAAAWAGAVPPSLEVLAFALLGLPVYVCASGATPLAAAMLIAGVSPGAALAFLLSGPATNVTTFGVLTQLHGRATAVRFAVTVFSLAVVSGLVVNAIGVDIASGIAAGGDHEHGWLAWASAAVLGLVFLGSVTRQGPRAFLAGIVALGIDDGHDHAHDGHDHAHDGHDHAHDGHDHAHDDHDHDDHDPRPPASSCGSGGCCG